VHNYLEIMCTFFSLRNSQISQPSQYRKKGIVKSIAFWFMFRSK